MKKLKFLLIVALVAGAIGALIALFEVMLTR